MFRVAPVMYPARSDARKAHQPPVTNAILLRDIQIPDQYMC